MIWNECRYITISVSFDTFVNRNSWKLSLGFFQTCIVTDDYQLYEMVVTRTMPKDSDKVCHCVNSDLDKLLFETKMTRQKQCSLYYCGHYYPINGPERRETDRWNKRPPRRNAKWSRPLDCSTTLISLHLCLALLQQKVTDD